MSDVMSATELRSVDCMCIRDDIEGELGCGLQSIVRLGHHASFGLVAIKCFAITGGRVERSTLEKKIKRELTTLRKAASDSVVRIYGWVQWPRAMGLVMEYLPAGSLRQFTTKGHAKLKPMLILRMAYEIVSALACMHDLPGDERLIHGDLKPENVLLTRELHCKLGDFGSAELVALTGATTTSSKKPDEQDMTLAYAAPEKLKDLNIKPKKEQDTYSFGMLLYVLLAGITPYQQAYQEIKFVESIKRGERPNTAPIDEFKATLDSNGQDIIARLESIMRRCWQQDPSDRSSMIDVRDELQELRNQQNEADILTEVAETLKVLSMSTPISSNQKLVELNHFSPIHGTFAQDGTVYNIYNLPNVQQAAIACVSATFELPSPSKRDIQTKHEQPSGDSAIASSSKSVSQLRSLFEGRQDRRSTDDMRHERSIRRTLSLPMGNNVAGFSNSKPASKSGNQSPLCAERFVQSCADQNNEIDGSQHNQQRDRSVTSDTSQLPTSRPASFCRKHRASTSSVDAEEVDCRSSLDSTPSVAQLRSFYEQLELQASSDNLVSKRAPIEKASLEDIFKQAAATSTSVSSRVRALFVKRRPSESSDSSSLPDNVRSAPDLLEQYSSSLESKEFEEADATKTKLVSLIEKHANATAEDVRLFGIKLQEERRYLESIAIFDAAATLCRQIKNKEDYLKKMEKCVNGMKIANAAMIKEDVVAAKMIANVHVIPLMRDKLSRMEKVTIVSKQRKCLLVCWVLAHIEHSEHLVDDREAQELTLRDAVLRMRRVFHHDVNKHGRLFGMLLNNLGVICYRSKRHQEAIFVYEEAIQAHKADNDYGENEEERKREIHRCENNLKKVLKKAK